MSEFNAEEISQLQKRWAEINVPNMLRCNSNMWSAMEIFKKLEDMGLDMGHDATYELLSPGLTRKEFDDTQTTLCLYAMLDMYHGAQRMTENRYSDGYANDHYLRLGELIEKYLPWFENALARSGMPDGVNPIHVKEAEFIQELKKNGFDIKDPDLYTEIGTDIDSFWDRYQRERIEVAKNDKYSLIKPEFNR